MRMKRNITKTLYIPIEIIDRELGGALLLSSCAVSNGWQVVLGGKQGIFNNMSRFKRMPGVFFLKSIVPGEVFKQKEIISYGHRVVSLDIEGLVPSNGESGVRLRYSDESIELTDRIFYWGKNHYESISKVYSQVKEKSVISGSPIIDEILILREKAVKKREENVKKKILIGTSCGYANHINGMEFSERMTKDAYCGNVSKEECLQLEYEAQLDIKIFDYWKQLISQIAEEFKDCDIILRPHPSENKDFWRKYIKDFNNIHLDEGGSILEEMVSSDIYIHFNSTSAITSMLLGLPTFMPLPRLEKELFDRVTFVKNMSIIFETFDELKSKLREYLEDGSKQLPAYDISQYCENVKQKDYSAAKVIIDNLDELYSFDKGKGDLLGQCLKEWIIVRLKRFKFFLFWSAGIFFSFFGIKKSKIFPPKNSYINAASKQPNTSLEKVKKVMFLLLGDKSEQVNIVKKDVNLFILSSRENR